MQTMGWSVTRNAKVTTAVLAALGVVGFLIAFLSDAMSALGPVMQFWRDHPTLGWGAAVVGWFLVLCLFFLFRDAQGRVDQLEAEFEGSSQMRV